MNGDEEEVLEDDVDTLASSSRTFGAGPSGEEKFVHRARQIALHLNHKEFQVAHFLLAMTMSRDGAARLAEQHLDEKVVRKACLRALEKVPAEPETPSEVSPSAEINRVWDYASLSAQQSGDREVQTPHILRAIRGSPLSPQFVSLYTDAPPTPEDTRNNVALMKTYIENALPTLANALANIGAVVTATGQKIDGVQTSIGNGGPTIRARLTTVKYMVVIALVVLGLLTVFLMFRIR